MKTVFATTSWKARIGTTLPKVIRNILEQSTVPDSIQIYLSLEEFPRKESEFPTELLEVIKGSSRVEFKWSEGNLKSFKRLLSIKENPDSKLVIYDDDTIHHPSWFGNCIGQLSLDDSVVYAGFIEMKCEDYELNSIYKFAANETRENFFNTSNGFIMNTNLYKNVEFDPRIPVDLKINDDDYYMNIINTINGIKVKKFIYPNPHTRLHSLTDMRVNGYAHKAFLVYLKESDPENYIKYMEIKHKAVKGLPVLAKLTLR